jgi:hypothetical protein
MRSISLKGKPFPSGEALGHWTAGQWILTREIFFRMGFSSDNLPVLC